MKNDQIFQIKKISNDLLMVFTTSYRNPINYLDYVKKELSNFDFNGRMIFDLLLANGFNSNRFVRVEVKNSEIKKSSMSIMKKVNTLILENSFKFYEENSHLLNNSILSEPDKFFLRNK